MNRLIWIVPLLGFLLIGWSSNTSVQVSPALNATETATPANSKPQMEGTWDLHISWDCNPPAYDLVGVMSDGYIQITDARGGKFPKGTYMVTSIPTEAGNLWLSTYNNSGKKTDDFIFDPNMTPIFIYNYTFVGTVNDERTQVNNGKFDITNNKGENTGGCWEAEKNQSSLSKSSPIMTPTMAPTSLPLPDPSSVIKEFGFTPYLQDFTCVDPDCKEYTKSGTGLFLIVYKDASAFTLRLTRDPGLSIGWVKKLLTALYPDFANEIVKAIPTKGTSGTAVSGSGENGNYKWTVDGAWGFIINVVIEPLVKDSTSVTSAPSPEKTLSTETGENIDRFAFSVESDNDRDIYLVNSDNSNLTRLTNSLGWDWSPVWSPDGKHIAFLSVRTGNSDIFVMDSDGLNLIQMTDTPAFEGYPAWSPDGKNIAFVSDKDEPDPNGCANSTMGCTTSIYLLDTATLAVKRITDSPNMNDGPTWSPDGKKIAFFSNRDGYREIYSMNLDGSDVIQLTSNKANSWRPAWSPDGKHIAFASILNEKENIFLMDPDGKNQIRLTTNNVQNSAPSWSPDSKSIVFNSSSTVGTNQICKIQISDSVENCLKIDFKNAFEPTWQPYPSNSTRTPIEITLPTQLSSTENQSDPTSTEALVLVSPATMKIITSWNNRINAFTSASNPIKELSGLTGETVGFWNNSKPGMDLYDEVVKMLNTLGPPWKDGLFAIPNVNNAFAKKSLQIYFTDDSITKIKDGKRIIFKSIE